MLQRLPFILGFIFLLLLPLAQAQTNNADSVSNTCSLQENCSDCAYASDGSMNGHGIQTIALAALVSLLSIYFYSLKKKRIYLILGATGAFLLLGSTLLSSKLSANEECIEFQDANTPDEFTAAGDEFQMVNEDDFKATDETFTEVENDSSTSEDFEFSATTLDEFSSFDASEEIAQNTSADSISHADKKHLIDLSIMLALMLVVGLFINKPTFQKLRPIFLLGMLIWLGFIHGGCPCMISSFQNLILLLTGVHVKWISLLWFLGLIPLTYFLGRVWCGWLCHLGALQEFIFSASRVEWLKKARHQKILRNLQIGIFVLLILQIFITKSNIYIHYDPFKVAFNLFSSNVTGYVLLGILLLSSLFIHRAFCRAVCPVGLVLGWISLLPGARRIRKEATCVDCVKCSKSCKSKAMLYEDKKSILLTSQCIACGECLDSCNKDALYMGKSPEKVYKSIS